MRKISSLDVAKQAGVSPATVSLVLNDRRDIVLSESTRERVRTVAAKLGYRPNLVARNLLRGRTETIGVIVARMDNSFSGRIVQGIQEASLAADYRVLLAHTRNEPEIVTRQWRMLEDHQVDGIICVADEATLPQLHQHVHGVSKRGLPCVLVDDRTLSSEVDCVVSDDVSGAAQVVKHFLSLGHCRIAHISAGTRTSSARDRIAGYRSAMKSAGIRIHPDWIVGDSYLKADSVHLLKGLLDLPRPPTAVFAANDRLLAQALSLLRERGAAIPDDLALAGYANFDFSSYLGFTTVEQHPDEMGRQAFIRLQQRMANARLRPKIIRISVSLLVRQSCGGKS